MDANESSSASACSASGTGPADPAFAGPVFNSPYIYTRIAGQLSQKGRQFDTCALILMAIQNQ
jgi:hypothetical protein